MINKQSNGKYIVTYSTRNKRGKKVKKQKSGVSSFTMAKRVEADFIAELMNKKDGYDYAGLTFESFLNNHYYPYCETQSLYSDYLAMSVNKWSQSIYKVKLEAITPNDILQILTDVAEERTYGTVKKVKSYLSRIFAYACNGGLKVNPCVGVKIPMQKEEVKAKVLTKEEVNILLNQSKELKPVWYKIWAFHLFTGLRSGEGYALLKTDIDIENNTISINKSWSSKVGVKCTKTGDWRIVPISRTLKPLVIELLNDKSNGEFLLPHPWQWKNGDQAKVLKAFCQGLGITSIKFHDLRATFITHMFANNASIAEVQSVVGHSDLKTTQVYLRIAGVNVKGATDKLNFVLPSAKSGKNVLSLKDKLELLGTQLAVNA
ncbi:site-specific integrase [bacterium]|nr:site-specific integrase [bacterium]